MIKKGITITVIFIVSTVIQLVSQIVVTRLFGASLSLDTFLAAVAIPTILVTVIYGTLNDAFLPLYGEKKIKDPHNADNYFFSHLLLLTFISFIVATVFGLVTQPISMMLYSSRGEEFVKNVATQMFYLGFSIPLSVIATLLGSYFYGKKEFNRFPLAQLIGSHVNVILIIMLAPQMGVWALIFAFVVNIFFQILFVIPREILQMKFISINVGPLLFAWIPLIVGAFAFRTDTLFIRSLAASLPAGNIVYLNLISKIFSLATSVMTIGIQVLLLPHLVEYLAKKEHERAIHNVNKAKLIALGVSMLMTILVALIAPLAITLLFRGGQFTQTDVENTTALIPYFILPAIGWGVTTVFFQPLLALKKQLPLAGINILSFIVAWIVGTVSLRTLNPVLAISFSLTALFFTNIAASEILWQSEKKKLIIKP